MGYPQPHLQFRLSHILGGVVLSALLFGMILAKTALTFWITWLGYAAVLIYFLVSARLPEFATAVCILFIFVPLVFAFYLAVATN